MSNARISAIKALLEISEKGAVPKRAIESQASSLDKRDRAFLTEVVYGVLRFRDTLDWIMRHFLKNTSRLGSFTLFNLRIALYQIYMMRVPDWASVNEAVEMEKLPGGPATGRHSLVNAVLRNVLRQKDRFVLPIKTDDPVTSISINTSHPKWLVKRWVDRFGKEEAALLAGANNEIPPMTLRVNTLRVTREELIGILSKKGVESEPTQYCPDGIVLKEARIYDDLSFTRGLFFVQDEASQLISYLLDPGPGQRILDACAAPGGKTTHIAQLMGDSGEVLAVEKNRERTDRIKENIENLGVRSIKIVNADINELNDIGAFDRILVDAPCSATGTIRRNPDVKYRHKPGDLMEYRSKQVRLLQSTSKLLKENGIIVYSVCSVQPEEGEEAVKEFLKTAGEFRIIDTGALLLKDFINKGFFRTYPHRHGMDGFFGVSICRKK